MSEPMQWPEDYLRDQLRDSYEQWSEEAKWRGRLSRGVAHMEGLGPRYHSVIAWARNEGRISEGEMVELHRAIGHLLRVHRRSEDAEERRQQEACFCHLPKCTWHPEQNHK